MSEPLLVGGLSLAAAALVMAATAVVAGRVGRVSVVDTAWGVALLAVAVVCAACSPGWLGWLLVALVAVWAGRLSSHVLTRSRGAGEDPRYEKVLGGTLPDVGLGVAVRKVFVVQGLAVWVVSLPLQAAAVAGPPARPWLVVPGVLVWGVGLLFETVGDAQLKAYRADPGRGPVMDRGLWSWTRHPNYFGDACIWWGVWLAGGVASGWIAGLVSLLGPAMMTLFLVRLTGARLLEQTMMQREGYPEYAARTSMFLPRPPRRRGAASR